ncbi:MAG: hypothetical protein PHX18_04800 [Candidatus Gastranaerophilales bacterium]|nr:hypothetical protein [Candidatus Gastranaerophilales bacterium]
MTSIQNNMSYDFNKDGKVTYDDYEYAVEQKITLTTDEVNAFDTLKLNEIVNQIEEDNGEIETAIVNEEKALSFATNLSEPPDTNDAKTLNALQLIAADLSAYIKNCAQSIKYLESVNEDLKIELKEVENEINIAKEKYEAKTKELAQYQTELTHELQRALTISEEETDAMNARSKNAIDKAISDYKDGNYPNQDLQDVITAKLSNIGIDKTRIDAAFSIADSTASNIRRCVAGIETITYNIKTANEKYNSINAPYNNNVNLINSLLSSSKKATDSFQNGFTARQNLRQALVDKYYVSTGGVKPSSISNPQVQMLNEFLKNRELDNMPFSDARVLLIQIFGDCISYNESKNKFTIPKGHGAAANIYNALVASLKVNYNTDVVFIDELTGEADEQSGSDIKTKRRDPIGFTYNNTQYEFIADKNNDGKFNNENEFLGADKGWNEMIAYDVDGNGLIEGEELKQLKLLGISEDGKYSFTSADKIGIDKIDLNSYNKISEKQINNNILEGTYTLSINGEDVDGIQTFDTVKNLENTFSTVFDQEISDENQSYKENPFMAEFAGKVNTKTVLSDTDFDKSKTENTVDINTSTAESKAKNYTVTAQDKSLSEPKDTSNAEEPAVAEENTVEKKYK